MEFAYNDVMAVPAEERIPISPTTYPKHSTMKSTSSISTKLATLWADLLALRRQPKTFAIVMGGAMLVMVILGSMLYKSSRSTGLSYGVFYSSIGSGSPPQLTTSKAQVQQQVLLITYGRSGSTFTSAIINYHKDVFFTFEPLYALKVESLLKKGTPALDIPRTLWLNDDYNESVAILDAFLKCDFPEKYVYAFNNIQLRNSDATSKFADCILNKSEGPSHLSCYMRFLKECKEHNIRFIKSIRFKVAWAEWFLEKYPNFKVLYLLRDPRATFYSQARVFRQFAWQADIDRVSKMFCGIMEEDLIAAERLKQKYPDRIMGIRYEHGALEPLDYTKGIYDFLGLEYNQDVEKYILDLTSHNKSDTKTKNDYTVVRANSSATMNSWRFDAGFNNVQKIDANCGQFYHKIGYQKVQSQADLESARSLVDGLPPGSIFSAN